MITIFVAALLSGQDYHYPANNCANPSNGLDVSACMSMLLTAETERMNRYLATAATMLEGRVGVSGENLSSALMQSQTRWEAYADATCGVVRDAADFLEQD